MIVGVPREIKDEESRVALTPSGTGALVAHGHRVIVERDAGAASSLSDALYRDAAATVATADDVWADAEMILKVKEPLPSEYGRLQRGRILFTYLHLAANPPLIEISPLMLHACGHACDLIASRKRSVAARISFGCSEFGCRGASLSQ